MKIIDNKKDYYDYLVGINGLDPDIVYDRRGSIALKSEDWFSEDDKFPNIGAKLKTPPGPYQYLDIPPQKSKKPNNYLHYYHDLEEIKKFPIYGKPGRVILCIGKTEYHILTDRYLEEDGETIGGSNYIQHIRPREDDVICPIILIFGLPPFYDKEGKHIQKISNGGGYALKNPILEGTWLTKLIPAEEVWEKVYNYLSSLKDKDIPDNRTDKEKIMSAGFDVKTSFRKM